MGARQHLGAVLDQVIDGRDGGADARVVGDVHVTIEWDVEIASDEDGLACCVPMEMGYSKVIIKTCVW